MTALRRVSVRGAMLVAPLLILTFATHHGLAAVSHHPLSLPGIHAHSDHHDAPHHDAPHNHDPQSDPVGHPKRVQRWLADNPLPDVSVLGHALVIQPPGELFASVEFAPPEHPPVLTGADRRALFQVFLI